MGLSEEGGLLEHVTSGLRGTRHVIGLNQNIRWNFQSSGQPANHFERQRANSVQHFGYARTGADKGFQIFSAEAARFHYMVQKIDWIRIRNRVMD